MIINIRGTSGAGKSHLVRQLMGLFKTKMPVCIPGRKQPYYYELFTDSAAKPVYVLGHYECACGGVDTIKLRQDTFALARELAAKGDVVYEGLLLSGEVTYTLQLPDPLHVIFLDVPIETCLASINMRRQARGKMEPVNPDQTVSKHKTHIGVHRRFVEAAKTRPGLSVQNLGRDEALAYVRGLLGV